MIKKGIKGNTVHRKLLDRLLQFSGSYVGIVVSRNVTDWQ